MRIKVKQRDWNSLRVESEEITEHEYETSLLAIKKQTLVDYEDYDDRYVKKNIFGKVVESGYKMTRRIYFAFTILEINDNEVSLKLEGIAGGVWNDKKKVYDPRNVTIKKGEEQVFKTDTLDSGKEFYISYVE